jgi:hypothetical protein
VAYWTADAFFIRQAGEVISVADFRRWPHDVAHMSGLTAAPARNKGLTTRTAYAAVEEALAQGLLPEWRARPADGPDAEDIPQTQLAGIQLLTGREVFLTEKTLRCLECACAFAKPLVPLIHTRTLVAHAIHVNGGSR